MPEAAAAHRKAICGTDRLYPGIRGPYQEPGEKAPAAESRGATRGGKQPTAEGRDATRGGKRSAATPHEAGNGRPRRHTRRETTGKGGPRCSICRPGPLYKGDESRGRNIGKARDRNTGKARDRNTKPGTAMPENTKNGTVFVFLTKRLPSQKTVPMFTIRVDRTDSG